MDDRKDTKAPEISALEKLGRAVEFTRLNRINASTRLLSNERFVQSINIYYSCAAAIVTVLSLIYPSRSFGVVSAVLTVILAISIVYLNAQKYGSRAQQLQANFIALQQLGYDISRAITKEQKDECEELQKRYIELLKTSENHIQHDHFHTLEMQDRLDIRKWENRGGEKQPKPRLRDYEKKKFWFEEIGFIVIKGIMWIAPIAYLVIVAFGYL